jgi:hypothetical protein
VIFRARFADAGSPIFAPREERLEVRLFGPDEIPWNEIAFPSVYWALYAWLESGNAPLGKPAVNPSSEPTRRVPDAIAASNLPVKPVQ